GLQRADGLSVRGRPDFEAVAAWIFGRYLNARLSQRSPEEAWDPIVAEIRTSTEWRSKSRPHVDPASLARKHLVGYQGWFYTPDDGANRGWDHWFRGDPIAENANVDFWPDTRELFDSELTATGMTHADGRAARLFSSFNPRTVRRHFEWLADAGIDGVS